MSEEKIDVKKLTISKAITLFLEGKISKKDLKESFDKDDLFKLNSKQLEDVLKTYDKLESSGFLFKVKQLIPQDEYGYMDDIVYDTIHDYETFANSFVGMISAINADANNLGAQVDDILSKIKNKEGLEELAAIKDIVG